ncbi:hypothetical protein SBV1_1570014 [Verrucomicrobia bacterium]|nr:hypothetical protein SBV1_1570014 [Verrucomicrobiota bacterium]
MPNSPTNLAFRYEIGGQQEGTADHELGGEDSGSRRVATPHRASGAAGGRTPRAKSPRTG